MFTKLEKTQHPPKGKPIMVFDGNCGFCRYWVVKWMRISKLAIEYRPYQEVAENFSDIPPIHFKEAVRFIDLDGSILSGPEAAYIAYVKANKLTYLHQWYRKGGWFMKLSDVAYMWVADHRNFLSTISIYLFGKNPANPKPYWKVYLLLLLLLLFSLTYFW